MVVLAMVVAAASALMQPLAGQDSEQTVIVTGTRLRDLEAALSDCLARNCPPNEDIDATLALAEGRFLDGEYEAAAETIAHSLRRNRRHGARFPEPVADLYRAQVRVMRHRGRDQHARIAVRRTLEVLKEGIPREDHRHFTARLEIVDMLVRLGDFRAARAELSELAERATAAERRDVARMADMRRLRLEYFLEPRRTMARLNELANLTDPAQRFEMISARLLLAAIYRMDGDGTRSDALLAGIPAAPARQLLFTPPFLADVREHVRRGDIPSRVSEDFRDAWVDVGYWIDAEGRIADVEVVRHGANPSWAEPLLRSIRGRIYSRSPDVQPSYRLERYTLTAPLEIQHGTRAGMRRDARRARIEFLDLTTENEPGRAPPTTVPPAQPDTTPPSASSAGLRRGGG